MTKLPDCPDCKNTRRVKWGEGADASIVDCDCVHQKSEMPREIEIDAKYTVKGYLQIDQWGSSGFPHPPINGNTRVKYTRTDTIAETLDRVFVKLEFIKIRLNNGISVGGKMLEHDAKKSLHLAEDALTELKKLRGEG